MSTSEIQAGAQFWADHAAALDAHPDDPAAAAYAARTVWEVLTRRVGVERAYPVAALCRHGAPDPVDAGTPRPRAHLMPDAWVITGYLGSEPAFTHHVVCSAGESLAAGPGAEDGRNALDPGDPHIIPSDDESRWLTDFSRALDLGMAAEIDLDGLPRVAAEGVDTLVVVGVREPVAGRGPAEEALALTRLLDTHADATELSLIAQGTPTNNLSERASGFAAATDPFAGYDRLFAVGVGGAAEPEISALRGGSSDGASLESALGLADRSLASIAGYHGCEQRHSRAMALALFPVTLGEAIAVLTRPSDGEYGMEFDEIAAFLDQVDAVMPFAREHFASYVRGRGPLPTVRVGRQPYGILPVLAGARYATAGDEPAYSQRLRALLDRLRPWWLRASGNVPNLVTSPRAGVSVSDLTAQILTQAPVPHRGGYAGREFLGRVMHLVDKAASLKTLPAVPVSTLAEYALRQQAEIVEEVRVDVIKSIMAESVSADDIGFAVTGSLLEDMLSRSGGAPEPMGRPIATADAREYLRQLAGSGVPAEIDDRPEDLLYLLLEHALALSKELDVRTRFAHVDHAFVGEAFASLLGSVGQVEADPASTVGARKKQLAALTVAEGLTADLRPTLLARPEFTEQRVDELMGMSITDALEQDDFRVVVYKPKTRPNNFAGTQEAVGVLADADLQPRDLTRLTGEVLDCCASRLDAWYTSLATQRLATLRASRPTGIQLGCWGVLVDVRRSHTNNVAAPALWENAAVTDGELRLPAQPVGYVHAPSLDQARTAGVLRSGELSHRDTGSSLASIDLTSKQVRVGTQLLDGVANGQSLGALLGYQLERELGDHGSHTIVTTLRARYPHRHVADAAAGSDAVTAAAVVDGLAVHEHHDEVIALPGVSGDAVCLKALDNLARSVEAVSDLLVAEGVHALTTGHSDTAGALFSAVATGSRPPDPAVTHEPRSGITITHKVVVGLTSEPPLAGWNVEAARARLAPHAERWAQSVIGPATDWVLSEAPGGPTVRLADLGVCALDVCVEAEASSPVFADRLRAAAGLSADDAMPFGHTYDRLVALAQAAGEVLAKSRPATAVDLTAPPEADPVSTPVAPEPPLPTDEDSHPVVAALGTLLEQVSAAVARVIEAAETATEDTRVAADEMRVFTTLGIPGAQFRAEQVTIYDAVSVAQTAAASLRDVAALLPRGGADDAPMAWEQRLAALRREDNRFDVLVEVTRRIAGRAVVPTLAVAHTLSAASVPAAPHDVRRWLTRLGRVRPNIAAYEDLRLFVAQPAPLSVSQLPFVPDEGWLGGALPAAGDPPPGQKRNELRRWRRPSGPRAHLVVAAPDQVLQAQRMHALVVDEVGEVLPSPTVTTGLAVHYDAPNARAPQSILLATPADPDEVWTHRMLTEMITDTLVMSRMRGVTLDELAPTGAAEFFPLTYVRQELSGVKPLEPRPNAFADIARARAIGVDALRIHAEL
ncbi:hypothetical protein [Mycolicibacterium litorale]|uniref:hypothetical protein n=1 Tax=Mycolicibacterium litorale TaxID=758802 RepID=UPI00141701F5|nr:hypothetical protein [Mycolicibacterium litorale]MCV7416497.1 hypothetical protein [Mycolicibacterium litorale]